MKDEVSIESLKAKIFSTNTSEYFEEVYSSYIHGNYRSAVVMLWSVVVLDIVQKVQYLKDSYEDKAAVSILDDIATLNEGSRKSSAWELTIVKKVCDLTDLIEDSEYTNLEYLQQQRHLSAHPVIQSDVKLYVPNRDTTRALIRNALEIILVKPPVYTARVLETVLIDLAENGNTFTELEELERYIQYKYLNRTTVESKLKLFEKFWKFVMHLEDTNCDINRTQNLRFLIILARDNSRDIERIIQDKISFYSRIKNEEKFMQALISFLIYMPEIYTLLSDDTKMLIELGINKEMNFCIASTYTKSSLEEHFDYLEKLFTTKPCDQHVAVKIWEILYENSDSVEMEARCLEALSLYYSNSANFDAANHAMTNIARFISKFDIDTFKYLIEQSETNNQTYGRSEAARDYKAIKRKIVELDKNFDFTSYTNFNRTVARAQVA